MGVVSSGGLAAKLEGVGATSAADVFSDVVSEISSCEVLSSCTVRAVPEPQLVCDVEDITLV